MKTYAHINQAGGVVGIGLIYEMSGELDETVKKFVSELGEDAGILAYGETVKPHIFIIDNNRIVGDLGPDPDIATIIIDTADMPGGTGFNYDKTFCGAFKHSGGYGVDIDLSKAKTIAHDKRRAARAKEFAPLDIEVTIPAKSAQAEAKRQAIRDKYDAIQTEIDACNDVASLKAVHDTYAGLVK